MERPCLKNPSCLINPPFASKMKSTWNRQHFDKRDKLDAIPERISSQTIYGSRTDQPEEAYHDKTDSRDSCAGAISDGADGSHY